MSWWKYHRKNTANNTRPFQIQPAPWPRLRVSYSMSKRGLAKRATLDLAIPFSDKMDERYEFDLGSEMPNMRMRCNIMSDLLYTNIIFWRFIKSLPSHANLPTAKNLAYFRWRSAHTEYLAWNQDERFVNLQPSRTPALPIILLQADLLARWQRLCPYFSHSTTRELVRKSIDWHHDERSYYLIAG